MTKILTPDLCVIGAGSGGLSMAAIARAFGQTVVLIEKAKMGGDCLNYGCVPSKAMIAAGKAAHNGKTASFFGVEFTKPKIDYQKVHDHIHDVIAQIEPNDSVERFEALGVHVIEAAACFEDEQTVLAGDYKIRAYRTIICTGSSAYIPPIKGLQNTPYLTNETIFDLKEQPDHLIVLGGGPIGLELAQAQVRLGAKVTVVERGKPLAKEDAELSEIVIDALTQEGVEFLDQAEVQQVRKEQKSIIVTLEKEGEEQELVASHLLIATGRKANLDGLSLDKADIEHSQTGIKVDAKLRTSNRKVYAIGDVTGGFQFTHVANYHAGIAFGGIFFKSPGKVNNDIIPWVTYTDPELAHVGLTESQAKKRYGAAIRVLKWHYEENDRARADRKIQGVVKIVLGRKGKILGASIVGANAGELIQMWVLAISNDLKIAAFRKMISPYPTLSEVNKRAALTAYAEVPKKPFVRSVISFLKKLG